MTAAFPLASPLSHHRPPARLLISFYRRDSSAELSTGVAVSGRPGSGDGHAAPRPPEKPTRRYLIIDDSRGWASRDSASDAAVFPPSSLHSARRLPARSLARLESMSAASRRRLYGRRAFSSSFRRGLMTGLELRLVLC